MMRETFFDHFFSQNKDLPGVRELQRYLEMEDYDTDSFNWDQTFVEEMLNSINASSLETACKQQKTRYQKYKTSM